MANDWRGWGADRRERFEKELTPEEMAWQLRLYQEELGDEFGVDQLLKILDIKAKAEIAYAVSDAPEYLADQIGLMQNNYDVKTIAKALYDIGELLEQKFEEE